MVLWSARMAFFREARAPTTRLSSNQADTEYASLARGRVESTQAAKIGMQTHIKAVQGSCFCSHTWALYRAV